MNDRLLTLRDVRDATQLSRSTIYRYVAAERFPAPIRTGPNTVRWRASELDNWLKGQPKAGSEDDL